MSPFAPGDVRIAWESIGSGQPVLLIMGLGYARWGWEPIVDSLATHHRVISFDNRGIGESDVPPGPYDAATMAKDALAVLDASGEPSAAIVGSSLGGMIAQELAISHPKRVDRLVLMSTTPGGSEAQPIPERTVRLISESASLLPDAALRRFVANALSDDAPVELIDLITRRRLASPQPQEGWLAQAAAGTTYDGQGRAATIAAPTLIVHGRLDNVIDFRNAESLERLIPDSRLEAVDAGHLFFWEQPHRAAEILDSFLMGP